MPDNTIYEENVNVTETVEDAKSKKDLTYLVGAGTVAVAAVGAFEGLKWVSKKAKKGIVKLAGKIEKERETESAETAEPQEATNVTE